MWKMLPAWPPQATTTRRGSRFWAGGATVRLNVCRRIYMVLAQGFSRNPQILSHNDICVNEYPPVNVLGVCVTHYTSWYHSEHYDYALFTVTAGQHVFLYLIQPSATCLKGSWMHWDSPLCLNDMYVHAHKHRERKAATIKDERQSMLLSNTWKNYCSWPSSGKETETANAF